MRVAVIQSSYLPWRGYFDFIRSVDLFVVYDDVQYSKNGWRNRNRLKTAKGLQWLTVPVTVSLGQRIDETRISHGATDWVERHRRQIHDALGEAPYFADAFGLWEQCVDASDDSLSGLNVRLLKAISAYLEIGTPFVLSSQYSLRGASTERLIDLLKQLGATSYLSGPSADGYLDKQMFADSRIRLEYKSYVYDDYPQLWGAYEPQVSVLDLIGNCGKDAIRRIESRSPDAVIVP
jgi:hypothetical protein